MGESQSFTGTRYLKIREDIPEGYAYHKIVLDHCGVPIDFIFLNLNASFERLTGINREHVQGKRFTESLYYLKDDEFDYITEYGRVALTGESSNFEFYSKALNKWYSIFVSSDKYLYFSAVFHDITHTKKLVNDLREANYLNEILLDAIPHPAMLIRKDRKVIAANKRAKESGSIIGEFCWAEWGRCQYLSAEDIQRKDNDRTDSEPPICCSFCQGDTALAKNEPINIQKKLNGFFWDIYWVPTQRNDVYLHYAIDITEQKKIETDLRESEYRFMQLTEATFEGICIHTSGSILDCNKRMETMFGYSASELAGMTLSKLITFGSDEYFGIKKDGTRFAVEILTHEMLYKGNKAEVLVVRDITEKKQSEMVKKENKENLRLLREAQEMDRLKTEFFANVSHEFRTPLNIIFTTLQLLESYLKKGSVIDAHDNLPKRLKGMKQNCFRLLRLINNLIDITKIDTGFISLKRENIDIVKVSSDICFSVADYMKDKNINFIYNAKIEPKVVACDPDKIERIILNLISNAIKFTNSGGQVAIEVNYDAGHTIISVEDNGIGIPQDKKDKIFDRFIQVDKLYTRSYEGCGIGLSLVKSLVEMHGGRIWVESEHGIGSKFIFTLPDRILETKDIHENPGKNSPKDPSYFFELMNIEFSDIYSQEN